MPDHEPGHPESHAEPPAPVESSVPIAGDAATVGSEFDPIADATLDAPETPRALGPADSRLAPAVLLGIDLGGVSLSRLGPDRPAEPPARPDPPAEAPAAPGPADSIDDEPRHNWPEPRRSSWPLVLLVSYASAMTLASGWLWWTGHRGRPANSGSGPAWASGLAASEAGDQSSAADFDSDPDFDPGHRASASAAVEPLELIAEDRRVSIGERLCLDALEVVPVGVSAGPVELERTRVDGRAERRRDGGDALRLRLLLRNASEDVIFAPLDEAFVREPDRNLPETFVQDASGTRVYAYRLPISSEWGIAGQAFRELRPGESMETIVVSDTDATGRLDGPLTWRLRLRTAPETTAVVGFTFEASEIDRHPRRTRPSDHD